MSFIPRPQEIYKHFKGNLYQITAVAQHTETDELLVVYQALYGDFKTYARPLEMFLSEVDREKYPNAEQKYRFELQGGDTKRQKERESSVQEVSRLTEAAKPTMTESSVAAQSTEAAQPTVKEPTAEVQPTEGELKLDPLVLEFLDADSYEQRLNILAGLHHRITDDMITTMAVACDIEVPEGETETRFASLKSCLMTLEKYECNRLR
ncbi:MAG: DUF1653 domain-containing protein [Lachnospiraceae bacterium]|nr:DUF1653 domain-containing protein [Lachnospiraceae bacterium]